MEVENIKEIKFELIAYLNEMVYKIRKTEYSIEEILQIKQSINILREEII